MKLYVKQKLFSIKDKYDIYDESGNVKYYVEGKVFSFGNKLTLYDANGIELYKINQEVFSFMPKYMLIKNNTVIAQIKKKLTFFKDNFIIEELGWEVRGDFWSHEYQILKDNIVLASIRKKYWSLSDSYEFDIVDTKELELVLGVIITIDKVIDSRQNNNS